MSLSAPFPPANESDEFGDWPDWRKDMGLGPHRGKDFNGLPEGTPIPASGTGRVVWIEWNNVLGHVVVVAYTVGRITVYIGYCHMLERTPLELGDIVTRGATVGRLGNTGSASTGTHLHMTASYYNGSPGSVAVIDPMQFFTGSTPAGDGFTPLNPELSEEDDMKFLYVDNDGNGKPIFVLMNTRTGKFIHTKDQKAANGWAIVWGNAIPTPRQEFLNALDAIQKTL